MRIYKVIANNELVASSYDPEESKRLCEEFILEWYWSLDREDRPFRVIEDFT